MLHLSLYAYPTGITFSTSLRDFPSFSGNSPGIFLIYSQELPPDGFSMDFYVITPELLQASSRSLSRVSFEVWYFSKNSFQDLWKKFGEKQDNSHTVSFKENSGRNSGKTLERNPAKNTCIYPKRNSARKELPEKLRKPLWKETSHRKEILKKPQESPRLTRRETSAETSSRNTGRNNEKISDESFGTD